MTTQRDDIEYPDDYSATDTVRGRGWGALILGLCLLPTPALPLGVLMTCAGVALLAITPKLQQIEDTSQRGWQDEQEQGRSGCGWVIWMCVYGALLVVAAGAVAFVVGMSVIGKGGL